MAKLTGPQLEQLLNAMLEAFDRQALGELLLFRLNRDIELIVSPADDLREATTKVIKKANQEGWLAILLRAAKDARPELPDFQAVVAGLLVMVEGGGRPEPVAGVSEDAEVKIISPVIRPEPLHIAEPFPMDLMRVPAGPFLMGSDKGRDKDADDDELPQHPVEVAEVYIGKYPVTNSQYAAFVTTTKHRVPGHWKNGKIPESKGDHPVVNVSWIDALEFTEWLSAATGRAIRLPTEAEWEKAARGTDGRIYPWRRLITPDRANYDNNVGDTTPVGKYSPQGDSPYGCADMVGNVWEWTGSRLVPYPYDPEDGRENLESSAARVVRGGSWNLNQRHARCSCRIKCVSDDFDLNIGFRVGVSP